MPIGRIGIRPQMKRYSQCFLTARHHLREDHRIARTAPKRLTENIFSHSEDGKSSGLRCDGCPVVHMDVEDAQKLLGPPRIMH